MAAKSNGNGNGKKPPKQAKRTRQPGVTLLQTVPKKRRGGDNAKTSETRARFLHAYEITFGNISAACDYADISRVTYYRWMKSTSRVNRRFQKRVEAIQPIERQVDYLEAKLMDRVKANDTIAIIFGLKAKGKHRGWTERPVDESSHVEDVRRIVEAIAGFLKDHPNADKEIVLQKFAEGRNVPIEQIQQHFSKVH